MLRMSTAKEDFHLNYSHYFKHVKIHMPVSIGQRYGLMLSFFPFQKLPVIYIPSVKYICFSLISYLSQKTRVRLVKVSVERRTWLPKLVMHQTVMAGNCLKKFILLWTSLFSTGLFRDGLLSGVFDRCNC